MIVNDNDNLTEKAISIDEEDSESENDENELDSINIKAAPDNEEEEEEKKNTFTKKKQRRTKSQGKYTGIYVVEEIQDKKIVNDKTLYFVKWEGYPQNSNTWEPEENIMDDSLIRAFESKNKKKLEIRRSAQSPKWIKSKEKIITKPKSGSAVSNKSCKLDSSVNKKSERKDLKGEHISEFTISQTVSEKEEKKESGDFVRDTAECIISSKKDGKGGMICLVQWTPRKDGTRPNPTEYTNGYLEMADPVMLLKYYELMLRENNII